MNTTEHQPVTPAYTSARRLVRRWAGPLLSLLALSACAPTPPPPPLPTPPPPLGGPHYQGPAGSILYVSVPRLNLRACPATNCQILGILAGGEPLTALSQQGGWIMVRSQASGREGWVGARYLSTQPGYRPPAPRNAGAPAPPPPSEEWAEPGVQAPGEAPAPSVQEEFAPAQPR